MKESKSSATRIRAITLLLLIGAALSDVHAQGTAFTYQGRLNANGAAANGAYDLRFTVYDSAGGGNVVAGPVTGSGVPVTNGLFTVTLDFGTGVFTGPARWLQIAVRTNGAITFTNLSPRQALSPSPYAIHAGTASNVVNGAVVKSLNNLKDNVTLAAGANVTLTPSGNTITIAAPGGGGGPWLLNGANAYYNGGNVGIGTSTPATKFTVHDPLYGIEHTDGTVRLATYLDGFGGWLGTVSNHKLHFYINGGNPSMTVDTTGNVGIGTATPAHKLTVRTPASDYGVEHTDGNVRLSTYVGGSTGGGWLGTISNHKLSFFADDNGLKSMTLDTTGNVGIGTTTPADKLYIAGEGASGYAIGIEGNARQNRDKGGWVKAMAKVNADGSIARQYSALGGTISAEYFPGVPRYIVTFPFQVDDRFIQLAPFFNAGGGWVIANISSFPSANSVQITLSKEGQVGGFIGGIANEFFIFVY